VNAGLISSCGSDTENNAGRTGIKKNNIKNIQHVRRSIGWVLFLSSRESNRSSTTAADVMRDVSKIKNFN